MRSKTLGILTSVLAGLQFVAGSTALPGLVPAAVAQWIQLIVGAIDVGFGVYIVRVVMTPRDLFIPDIDGDDNDDDDA